MRGQPRGARPRTRACQRAGRPRPTRRPWRWARGGPWRTSARASCPRPSLGRTRGGSVEPARDVCSCGLRQGAWNKLRSANGKLGPVSGKGVWGLFASASLRQSGKRKVNPYRRVVRSKERPQTAIKADSTWRVLQAAGRRAVAAAARAAAGGLACRVGRGRARAAETIRARAESPDFRGFDSGRFVEGEELFGPSGGFPEIVGRRLLVCGLAVQSVLGAGASVL